MRYRAQSQHCRNRLNTWRHSGSGSLAMFIAIRRALPPSEHLRRCAPGMRSARVLAYWPASWPR